MKIDGRSLLNAYMKLFFAVFRGFCLFAFALSMAMMIFYLFDKITVDQYGITWGELALIAAFSPTVCFGLYFFAGALRALTRRIHGDF